MITLDQSKIDAPDFPRSQEWWERHCPRWVAATVHDNGTVTLEPSGLRMPYDSDRGAWWERDDSPGQRRRTEKSLSRWIQGQPRLAVAIADDSAGNPA